MISDVPSHERLRQLPQGVCFGAPSDTAYPDVPLLDERCQFIWFAQIIPDLASGQCCRCLLIPTSMCITEQQQNYRVSLQIIEGVLF